MLGQNNHVKDRAEKNEEDHAQVLVAKPYRSQSQNAANRHSLSAIYDFAHKGVGLRKSTDHNANGHPDHDYQQQRPGHPPETAPDSWEEPGIMAVTGLQ